MTKLIGLGSCLAFVVVLTIAAMVFSEGPHVWGIFFVIAFASYPVLVGAMAITVKDWATEDSWFQRCTFLSGVVGAALAVWLNYPTPKVKMVAPLAGIVLMLCFAVSGALLGSLVDLRQSRKENERNDQQRGRA